MILLIVASDPSRICSVMHRADRCPRASWPGRGRFCPIRRRTSRRAYRWDRLRQFAPDAFM